MLVDAEVASLVELAHTYTLTRDQVHAAHRGFLLALAHKVVEDSKVTRSERDELLATADLLGFADGIVKAVLDEAQQALARQRSSSCRPLPAVWAHGEPLRVGDSVVFTGGDPVERAGLEGAAQAAGLRVAGAVSAKTRVLVSDRSDATTTKAVAARERSIRFVSPQVFAQLVEFIQPAATESVPPTAAVSRSAPNGAASTGDSPATVRAWARDQGLDVGVRGRVPAEVLVAYQRANARSSLE